jgi:hypothetical protein
MYALSYIQSIGWLQTIMSVLFIWSLVGGLALLQYYMIRVFLARFPDSLHIDQAHFDDAVARILLCRESGGYRFIHLHLRDYFADTYQEPEC